jgi:MA3 domain
VHNPSGEGVRAISAQAQAKASKIAQHKNGGGTVATSGSSGDEGISGGSGQLHPSVVHTAPAGSGDHETKTKEGTAKRNIVRKKTADKDSGNYDSTKKKQGGHGKAQWKDAMDPSYTESIPISEDDPIYDEAEDCNRYILTSSITAGSEPGTAGLSGFDPNTSRPVFGPLLTKPEFKIRLTECLKEYYDSCDADEVIRSIEELGCQEYHAEVVKKAISLAMDKGSRERELTSRLLTCLHPTPLSDLDMEAGFVSLLDSMEDLVTDVPEAKV